jgi:hypothetical protein
MEETLSQDCLQPLSECYSHFFYHYEEASVPTINTEHLDPLHKDAAHPGNARQARLSQSRRLNSSWQAIFRNRALRAPSR